MHAASTARRLTYEDYCLIPEDRNRHEIIDGIHYVSAAPNTRHQRILGRIFIRLYSFVEQNQLGEVLFSPVDVLFSQYDVVQPDVVFISNERISILTEPNIKGAPNLVVEVLSPSNRRYDLERKKSLYEQFQVPEYWIVDPDAETVEVYVYHDSKGYKHPLILASASGDVLETNQMPSLGLSLAKLFER